MDIQSILTSLAAIPEQADVLREGEALKGRVVAKSPEGFFVVQIEGNGLVKVKPDQALEVGKLYSIEVRGSGAASRLVFTLMQENGPPAPTLVSPFADGPGGSSSAPPTAATALFIAGRFLQPEIQALTKALDALLPAPAQKMQESDKPAAGTPSQPAEKIPADPVMELARVARQNRELRSNAAGPVAAGLERTEGGLEQRIQSVREALVIAVKQTPSPQTEAAIKELDQLLRVLRLPASTTAETVGATPKTAARGRTVEAQLPSWNPASAPSSIPSALAKTRAPAEPPIISGWVVESASGKAVVQTRSGTVELLGPFRPPIGSWVMATVQRQAEPSYPNEPFVKGEVPARIESNLRQPIAQWNLSDTIESRKAILFLLGQNGFVTRDDLRSLVGAMDLVRPMNPLSAAPDQLPGTLSQRNANPADEPGLDAIWSALRVLQKSATPVTPESLSRLLQLTPAQTAIRQDVLSEQSPAKVIELLERILANPQKLSHPVAVRMRELLASLRQMILPWPDSESVERTAAEIQRAIGNSGVFFESRLAKTPAGGKLDFVPADDLKGALLELIRLVDQTGSGGAPESASLRQEAGRLLSRIEQQQFFPSQSGEQFVIPFSLNGEQVPVNLIFQRQGKGWKQPGTRAVSVHCNTTEAGHIRADIRMTGKRVWLSLACAQEDAAILFEKESAPLRERLAGAGISLERFSVRGLENAGQETLDKANRIDIII